MKYKELSLGLIFSLFCFSVYSQNTDSPNVQATGSEKMICLTLHVTKTAAHPEGEWTVTKQTVVEGKLKFIGDTSIARGRKGQWAVALRNKTGKMVAQAIVNNPLDEHAEYINESGQMEDVVVNKTEADISIRLPYTADCQTSEIKMFKEDKSPVTISSLTLTPGKK
jgi:hypothetical protein